MYQVLDRDTIEASDRSQRTELGGTDCFEPIKLLRGFKGPHLIDIKVCQEVLDHGAQMPAG